MCLASFQLERNLKQPLGASSSCLLRFGVRVGNGDEYFIVQVGRRSLEPKEQ